MSRPVAAVFESREMWLWNKPPDIAGALFLDGSTMPDQRGILTPEEQPSNDVHLDRNGTVAWAGWIGEDIELQRIPASGSQPLGLRTAVGSSLNSEFDLAAASDGGVMVVWHVPGNNPFNKGPSVIRSCRVAPDGTPADDCGKVVATGGSNEYLGGLRITALSDGTFAIGIATLKIQRLDAQGDPLGTPRSIDEDFGTDLAATGIELVPWSGGVVMAWGNRGSGTQRLGWQFFDTDLDPVGSVHHTNGGAFPVTDLVSGEPVEGLASSPDGRVLLTWESEGRIAGQFLDAPGGLQGSPFLVSLPGGAYARNPDAAFGPDGKLTVVWQVGPADLTFDPECGTSGFAIHGRRSEGTVCSPGALCLRDDRFEVTVAWDDPHNGTSGVGMPVPINNESGSFWFFDAKNLEMLVKVIDGRPVNGHFWVFYGSLTNVAFELTVRDRVTNRIVTYRNPPFTFASNGDTTAFAEGTP